MPTKRYRPCRWSEVTPYHAPWASTTGKTQTSSIPWNDGYGGIVRIEHPNGTATTYAHMGEVDAEEGAYVKQKERIGAVGNTGNTHGRTGCHLHFEVEGAKNPFTK